MSKTHGLSRTPTYQSWNNMRQRCNNTDHVAYARYGGRGIKICRRWRKFENFLADMGEQPAGLTLDRKNVNGNYTPTNCRWETYTKQNRNRRNNKLTAAKVAEIRRRHRPGLGRPLAREYGVSQRMVQFIIRGETWI